MLRTLDNGLQVVADYDASTPMVCVDIMYRAGGRYATGRQAGMAHLLEHLMFGGSANAPSYDKILDSASGTNNAWTSDDVVNYWSYLPAANIETALFLEADRLRQPLLDQAHLDVQRSVVTEEFLQTHLNQPYGRVTHHVRQALYGPDHPYGTPVIGRDVADIKAMTVDEVRDFFDTYYRPDNAVLVISGGAEPDRAFALAEKYFGTIRRRGPEADTPLPQASLTHNKIVEVRDPLATLPLAIQVWPMAGRGTDEYYQADLMTDILSEGRSSRFFNRLLLATDLFTGVEASISGLWQTGHLLLTAQLSNAQSTNEQVQEALNLARHEMKRLTMPDDIQPDELRLNAARRRARRIMQQIDLRRRAETLAKSTLLGIDYDTLPSIYEAITPEQIAHTASAVLSRPSATVITYPGKE